MSGSDVLYPHLIGRFLVERDLVGITSGGLRLHPNPKQIITTALYTLHILSISISKAPRMSPGTNCLLSDFLPSWTALKSTPRLASLRLLVSERQLTIGIRKPAPWPTPPKLPETPSRQSRLWFESTLAKEVGGGCFPQKAWDSGDSATGGLQSN